jgi:hypothetical protein
MKYFTIVAEHRSNDAIYWTDYFLQLKPRSDDYHKTKNVLSFCKKFITKELPEEMEITKSEQANYLNKSIQFFKERDSFDLEDFSREVIEKPELIEKFNTSTTKYSSNIDLNIRDPFTISDKAVKKQTRVFKSVLKLDKNFHIYIHGNSELIKQGIDDDGRKYYKIFYDYES